MREVIYRDSKPRCDLADIEQAVCKITSEQLGIPLHKLSLSDRLIEDLHCDSLELIELLMELEDEFQVVIPNHPPNPTYKSVFTRTPFRLSNLAELIYLQQDGPLPTKKRFSHQPVATAESSSVPFTKLGGLRQNADTNQPLLEFLEAHHGTSVYRRRSDGMRCMLIPKSPVEIGFNAQGESSDEYPMHTCELDAFVIDAEPVTTTAYCRFLNSIAPVDPGDCRAWFELDEHDNRSRHALIFNSNGRWQPVAGTEKLPMILVSWYGAHAYSLWANGQDWRGYRSTDSDYCFLPSEAQWARGRCLGFRCISSIPR